MLLQSHRGCTCKRFSVRYHTGAGSLSPQNSPHQDLNSWVAAIPKLITLPYPIARRDMFTQWFFSHFYVHGFGKGLVGFYSVYKKKQLNCMGRGLLVFCKAAEPHRFLSCLRYLKHAWNCCLWVRSGFSSSLFLSWSYQDCQVGSFLFCQKTGLRFQRGILSY